jgi:hypothetical protein
METPTADTIANLLEELKRSTLARASAARFARINDRGRITSVLQLTPAAQLAANSAFEEVRRWVRAVAAVLDRRGESRAARQIELLAADAEPLVRCRRKDIADITETRWRTAYAEELTVVTARLSAILAQHGALFESVGRGAARTFEVIDVCVRAADAGRSACAVEPGIGPGSDVEYGRRLHDVLVRCSDFETVRSRCNDVAASVRFQLRFDGDNPLGDLRWELLHDGEEFVALRPSTSISRGVPSPFTHPELWAAPLRLLVTISAPRDLEPLDVDLERSLLESSLAPLVLLGAAEIEFAPDGKLDTLRRLARAAADRGAGFHAWHYIGHGDYDQTARRGTLLMEDEHNGVHAVGGDELAMLFRSYGGLSAAVLNCCHAGETAGSVHAAVPACALVRSGIPAVVAMQSTILDDAAGLFAEELYGALCDGRSIDDAVKEGRRRLFLSAGATRSEWSTPVLFTAAKAEGDIPSRHS